MNQSKIMRRFKANLDVRIYILKADLDSETTSLLKTLESTIEDNDGLSVCVYDAMPFYNKLNTDTREQIIRIHQQSTHVLSLGLTQEDQLPANVIEVVEQQQFAGVPTKIERSREVDVENAEVVEHDDDLMGVAAPIAAPAVVAPAGPALVVFPPPPVAPPIIPPAPVPPALPVVAPAPAPPVVVPPIIPPRDLVEIDMDNWNPGLFDDPVPAPADVDDVIVADDVVAPVVPAPVVNDLLLSQADYRKAKNNAFIKQTIQEDDINNSMRNSVKTYKQVYDAFNKTFIADTEHLFNEKTSTMPDTRRNIIYYAELLKSDQFRDCIKIVSIAVNTAVIEYLGWMIQIADSPMMKMGMPLLGQNIPLMLQQAVYGGNREDILRIRDDFNYWTYHMIDVTRVSPYEAIINDAIVNIIYEEIIRLLVSYPIDPRNNIHDVKFKQEYEEIITNLINKCLLEIVTEDFFVDRSLKINQFIKEFNNICLTIYFHIMLFIVNHIEDDAYDFKKEYIMLYRILLIANNFTKISNYRKINNYLAYNFEKKAINDLHNSFALDDGFDGFDDDRFHDSVDDDDGENSENGENGENEESDELNPINVFDYLDGGKIPLNSKISKDTYGCINLQFFMFYNPENTSTKYNLIKSNYRKFLDDSYKIYSLNTLVLRLKLMFLIEDDKITYKDHVRPMLLNKIRIICPGENNPELIEFEQLLKFFDERNDYIIQTNNIKEYPSIIDDVEYLNKSLGLLQEKYQKILDRTWNGDAGLITLIENTMATSYIELYKLINRVGYNPEVRDVIIDTIINETTSNETEFALMLYNAIKKQKIPSQAFAKLIDRRNDNHNRSTEKFANFLIGVDKRLGNLLSNDSKHNRICDFISKQPRNIQKQIFQSFKSTDELLDNIKSSNSEQKEMKQLTEKQYETVSKHIRTFKYKEDSKFDCVIIPLDLFDCARLTDITFESLAIINNMHLKHMNPRTLPKYYYFIYHQQLCRISVDDLANGYIDYNTLLQPNTPIETKVQIILTNGIINNAEEYRQYLIIEKYCLLNNGKLTYDNILYEDLETLCGYRYNHDHRVLSYFGRKREVLDIINDYIQQYEDHFDNKKQIITPEIANNIEIFKRKLLIFFIEVINNNKKLISDKMVINDKTQTNEIITKYIETIALYGLNNISLNYIQLPQGMVPRVQHSTINKLIHKIFTYRFNKLKYITFNGYDEHGNDIEIPYIDYDLEDKYNHEYLTDYICSIIGPLKMVHYQDSSMLSKYKFEDFDPEIKDMYCIKICNEKQNIENLRAYPPYRIDKYEKLLSKDYSVITEHYCTEDYMTNWGTDVGEFEYKDWTLRYISNLNYVFGIKIIPDVKNYDKKYPVYLDDWWNDWYKDFDPTTETCLYVKLHDFPKFINENKTKTIRYIEYHYDLGLYIRISKNPRPKKGFLENLRDSIKKSNKSDNNLFGAFNEMFINNYKDELLKKFTIDCVLRTIVEHIIVNILKLNPVERRSLFTDWIDKIIEEDEKSYSTTCNKYFDLFCEIITNNIAKPKKGKSDKISIYELTNTWARQNPRAKINKADILLIQQIILSTEPIDWRTLIEDYNGKPVSHLTIDPGILDLCVDDDETHDTKYNVKMYAAFDKNLYPTSRIFITKYQTIPFIEIIYNDFINPLYEPIGEYKPDKILNDGSALIQFDQKHNRLTKFHNILATKEFIDYRKQAEVERELPSKSLLIKYSRNNNKVFFDYTLRLNEERRIDIEKDFVYKFNIYTINKDENDFETKTILATLIQSYALYYVFIVYNKFGNTSDIFEKNHNIVSNLIGESFKLPGEDVDPILNELSENIFVTGNYEDAKTILNEVDKPLKPTKPLPEDKNQRLALLKYTFEYLIDFVLHYRPVGILKSIREVLEKIVKNISLERIMDDYRIIYRLDLSSWTIGNIMKVIGNDKTITQNIESFLPKEVSKNQEKFVEFTLYYSLFIIDMLMTVKTRLKSIINNIFLKPAIISLSEIDDEFGLNNVDVTRFITNKLPILTNLYELQLFRTIEYLYNNKELNTANIEYTKNEEKQLKIIKEKIQKTVGFELDEEYINKLIYKYVLIITQSQIYKNGEIVNVLKYEIDDFINRLHKNINNPLITVDEVSEIIHDLFNDDSVTESELNIIYRIFGIDSEPPNNTPEARYIQQNNKYINKLFFVRKLQDFKTYTNADELKQDLKREFEIKYETAKYAVKLNPMIKPAQFMKDRYYYMLSHNPSLINGLLMSPDFIKTQEQYNKTLARKVFNRIVEKGSFNLEAYSINHQLILRYVYHTKKDYLKYIPYYIWSAVEAELHYENEPEMKLYGGKPKENTSSTRVGISTFAYLLLVLLFVIVVVVIIVVLFIKTKPLIQNHITTTK